MQFMSQLEDFRLQRSLRRLMENLYHVGKENKDRQAHGLILKSKSWILG